MTKQESKLLKKVIDFVDKANKGKTPHFAATLKWVKKIKPDADVALQIAVYSHDIKRPLRKKSVKFNQKEKGFMNEGHLKHHQCTGAKIMADFLKKIKVIKPQSKLWTLFYPQQAAEY